MIDNLQGWLAANPDLAGILEYVGVGLLILAAYLVAHRYVARGLLYLASRTATRYDDVILSHVKPRRLALVAPLLVINAFASLLPAAEDIISRGVLFVALWLAVLTLGGLLDAYNEIFESRSTFTGEAIRGYLDVVKILSVAVGIILSFSLFTGQSPLGLLTGLGAVSAVLLLVFRDTILSFVASLHISANDLVLEGDWLEVPEYDADGDVVDITLHQIRIQNWDKTISVVPTHKMLEVAYKNWRGMSQSGGRRIKRAIHIDLGTVAFADAAMLKKFRRIALISDYVDTRLEEIRAWNAERNVDESVPVNGRRLTNLGTFRAYCLAYLRAHPSIRQDMTLLVRQLDPGPTGLPLELYIFTNTTEWIAYEGIQSDIFDHLLAALPEFGLRLYQQPSGHDVEAVVRNLPPTRAKSNSGSKAKAR